MLSNACINSLLVFTNICIRSIAYDFAMFCNQRNAISIYQCGNLFFSVSQPLFIISTLLLLTARNMFTRKYSRNVAPVNYTG